MLVALASYLASVSASPACAQESINPDQISLSSLVGAAESQVISHWWSVTNHANQPVWGQLTKQKGSYISEIGFSEDAKFNPGVTAQTQQSDDAIYRLEYTWGRFCYRGSWWNLPRRDYPHAATLTLETAWDDADRLTIRNKYQEFPLIATRDADCPGRSGQV